MGSELLSPASAGRPPLKPSGKLLFVEHGLWPEPGIERRQRRLTPIWYHVSGGCHLDRKMDDLIRSADFNMIELRTEYANGPRPMTYMYLGRASRHRKHPEAAACTPRAEAND
jgi:hypothetical protein